MLALLRPIVATLDTYGRALLVDAAYRAEQWRALVEDFSPPVTIGEIAVVVRAAVRLGEFELARSTVREEGGDLGLPGPQQAEFLDWIAAAEAIG